MNVRKEFLSNYMVHLKGALPQELCEGWGQDYFVRTGIDESDPSTFPPEASRFSHASSQNPSGRIRFMNNKVVSLNQPMQFNRPDGAYTALEASILQALEVDSLDFHITGQRLRSEDFSQLKEEEVVA